MEMNIITIIFIAFGLAMDAFAISITSGITIKDLRISHAVRIATFFGLFQAVMPVIGWFVAFHLRKFVSAVDPWIAFGLLTFIGCKMVYESFESEEEKKKSNPIDLHTLLLLSIATSIDALAIGISFAFLRASIVAPIIVIGTITFILSFIGVLIGDKFGQFFEKKAGIVGGVILIGIGIKILIEHLF